jgi:hypothetical protein
MIPSLPPIDAACLSDLMHRLGWLFVGILTTAVVLWVCGVPQSKDDDDANS